MRANLVLFKSPTLRLDLFWLKVHRIVPRLIVECLPISCHRHHSATLSHANGGLAFQFRVLEGFTP